MFPTTRRSVILALGSDDREERERALDTLIAIYWRPLYKYLRVAWHRSPEDAEDLTQSFFTLVVTKEPLGTYDPAKASFRTFLRTLLDRHAGNEQKSAQRLKRGGSSLQVDFTTAEAELAGDNGVVTPEEYFHREWVRSVFAAAVDRLRGSLAEQGRGDHFALFQSYDLDEEPVSYRDLADRFGMTETNVTNRLAAVRRQFRQLVLDTLREATATDAEFEAEARALLGVSE